MCVGRQKRERRLDGGGGLTNLWRQHELLFRGNLIAARVLPGLDKIRVQGAKRGAGDLLVHWALHRKSEDLRPEVLESASADRVNHPQRLLRIA